MKKSSIIALSALGVAVVGGGGAWAATSLPASVEGTVSATPTPTVTPTIEATPTPTIEPTPAPTVTVTVTPTPEPAPVETTEPEPVDTPVEEPIVEEPAPPSAEELFLAEVRMYTTLDAVDDATLLARVPVACSMPYYGVPDIEPPFPDLDPATNGNYIGLAHEYMCD